MSAEPVAISVVIPVYNGADTLRELLESLVDQDSEESFEVVVSDDGSSDGSMDIARSFAGDLQLVICEGGNHRGAAAARNTGAAQARAAVLAFCDADDIAHKAWVRSLCAASRRERFLAGAVYLMTEATKTDATTPPDPGTVTLITPVPTNTPIHAHLPWTMTANLAVYRDIFVELGGFSEQLKHGYDADFCWRVGARGIKLSYEPDAIIFKRPRSGVVALFRQYLGYGLYHPLLFQLHRRTGMPHRSLRQVVRRYGGTAVSVVRALRHPTSASLTSTAAARVGRDLGRIIGSVRWRALYL